MHSKGNEKKLDCNFCNQISSSVLSLARLGRLFSVPDDLFQLCEAFVCQLYRSKLEDVNKCRNKLFSVKSAPGESLPPTQYALRMHVQRANYQDAVWSRNLQAKPDILSLYHHGWKRVDGKLSMQWMTQIVI